MTPLRRSLIRLAHTNPDLRSDLLPLPSRRSTRMASFEASLTYLNWLKARDFEVTEEQRAEHTHMVRAAEPLVEPLRDFVNRFGLSHMMTKEEEEVLFAASRILKTMLVPQVLLKDKPKKPIKRPGQK